MSVITRPRVSDLCWSAGIFLVLAFMLLPIIVVIIFSFGSNPHASAPMGALTLKWYAALFDRPDFPSALQNSAIITGTIGVLSAIIGTAAGFALAGIPPHRAGRLLTLLTLPIAMPPLVLALALAVGYSTLGIQLGLYTVIAGQLVFTQPFVVLVVYAQMANFDAGILESARDLGASRWVVFKTIILPIIRPVIIGATLIAMSVSLDDFIITFFTIGGGLTLPTMIWGMLRTSLDPSVNALGSLVLITTMGASMIALKLTDYRG
jgi:spermidine/putrescine transport system permease protein